MSASGLIVFRLFSGPHMGAELVLPAGNQLVGSDDSCDIILQDSSVASRHANIVIGFSGDGAPSVRVTPLDGEILLNGAPLPSDGADIPARTPFFLGLTCMAWSEPGEPADAWRQVASGLQERRSVQERPEPAEPQAASSMVRESTRQERPVKYCFFMMITSLEFRMWFHFTSLSWCCRARSNDALL